MKSLSPWSRKCMKAGSDDAELFTRIMAIMWKGQIIAKNYYLGNPIFDK